MTEQLQAQADCPSPTTITAGPAQDFAALLASLVAEPSADGGPAPVLRTDDTWAHASYTGWTPLQGWKLHVSGTLLTAESVVRACAPVLHAAGCSFKIARDSTVLTQLNGPHCPRGNAGKFLTAYPADDDTALALAAALDEATQALDGPRILSDKPVREGALVHYRYGAFRGTPHVDADGEVSAALVAPDGTVVPDRREARFTPPAWAVDPFAGPVTPMTPDPPTQPARPAPAASSVLLDGRYAVREAIRHANRGGVFRALDTVTGNAVIVKQARRCVGTDLDGHDVTTRLRHEARVLQRIQLPGRVPRPLRVFEQGGDLFLAETDLGGRNLRAWVGAGTADGVVVRPYAETHRMLTAIAELVAELHERGLVIRDLSPNNVLVTDDDRPALVDLELALLPGDADVCRHFGKPGYAPPEQFSGDGEPSPAVDSHALGAIILYCLTGEDPVLGREPGRRAPASIEAWLAVAGRAEACPDALLRLATALCHPDPGSRATPARTAAELAALAPAAGGWTSAAAVEAALVRPAVPLPAAELDEAITALGERLLADISLGAGRVTRVPSLGESTLATNVQHGAAGVLGVLAQLWRGTHDDRVLASVSDVARWLENARTPPGGPVGLYFGASGACWALTDAAAVLDDDALRQRAVDRMLTLPLDGASPDVTHGLAGLGLALVHLFQETGDDRLAIRLHAVTDQLLERAGRDERGVSWRTPAGVPSSFAGQRFHGFAHGTAGIGLFLAHAGQALGRSDASAVADEAARSLLAAEVRRDGCSHWESGPDHPGSRLVAWCNGSPGVATFLARHALLSPHGLAPDAGAALAGTVRAVLAAGWQSGIAYCHGLSGNADTLLDIADVIERSGPSEAGPVADRHRRGAAGLAGIMWDRRVEDEHGIGLSDEPRRIAPDFNVGYGGVLSFLLRLREGGSRLWLPAVPA